MTRTYEYKGVLIVQYNKSWGISRVFNMIDSHQNQKNPREDYNVRSGGRKHPQILIFTMHSDHFRLQIV